MRITNTGTKSFVLVYRIAGRPRRLTIGRYPTTGLADARILAQKALAEIAQGLDPRREPDEAKKETVERTTTMFGILVDKFVTTHCHRHNKPSTAKETERLLKVDFLPNWRKKSVGEICKADVLGRLDEIVAKGSPSAANHAYAAIRKFFNWCVQRGHIEVSPCMGVSAPSRHRSRNRVLSDEELATVWSNSGLIGGPFGSIVHLLILTAQRRGEVASMRWQDLDMEAFIWSLPAELTKSNRAHSVPLPPLAASIITALPRLDETFVFPGRGETQKPYAGFNKAKKRLDDLSGLDHWTLHDLRRTAATGMAKSKIAPHVIERILNHTTGTLGGIAGVYNRFGYIDEMRDALEQWQNHVIDVVGTPNNFGR